MEWLQFIQTVLLVVLVDRQLILRDRHIIGIENYKPYWSDMFKEWQDGRFQIWILRKQAGRDYFGRDGGKLLVDIKYNKINKHKKPK